MQHRKRYLFASQLILVLFSGMFISSANAMGGGMQGMMQGGDLKTLPPGLPAELLPAPQSSGAKLLQRYCAQCHPLPGPGRHTAEEWPAVLKRMVMNMEHMSGGMMSMMVGKIDAPSPAEQRTLRSYLQRYAQRAIDADQFPDLDSTVAGRAFAATCARCHVLPDPRQFTAIEWIGVEGRMQRNMSIMGRSIPDDATLEKILGFLQRHAQAKQ